MTDFEHGYASMPSVPEIYEVMREIDLETGGVHELVQDVELVNRDICGAPLWKLFNEACRSTHTKLGSGKHDEVMAVATRKAYFRALILKQIKEGGVVVKVQKLPQPKKMSSLFDTLDQEL